MEKFPAKKREEPLFGSWSFKDVIGHLSAWSIHQTEVFESVLEGQTPERPIGTKRFNNLAHDERDDLSWEEVSGEYISVNQHLRDLAESTPPELWNVHLWKNKSYTLKSYFEVEIKHFRQEHLKDVRPYLQSNIL